MFLSKNRRKSAKKAKQRDTDLSIKVCKQKIITNSRMIAGSEATILNSDQRSSHNQNKSDSNPVEQSIYTEPISSNVFGSSTSNTISDSNGEITCGENLNRRTYSLEQVSKSLDQVMASGKALLDALASVNGTQLKNIEGNTLTTNASATSRTDLTKRGTYDLDEFSNLLDASDNNDSTLESSSNDISQDYSKADLSNSSIKRSTYDLDAVSSKLDQSFEQNTCLEEMLLELSLDSTQNDSSGKLKRATYDLENVETALNESLNSDNNKQESLEEADDDCSLMFNQNRRGTYDLSDVSDQQDYNIDTSTLSEKSDQNTSCEQAISVRRGTYNLSDVSDLLDGSVNSGKSIDESLGEISLMESKRQTYDLSESNLAFAEQSIIENISDNNNTMPAESEKRNTFVLEDSNKLSGQGNVGNNSEKLSENGCHDDAKPVDGVLADLCLDEGDGRRETELTPGQWIEQMKGLKALPTLPTLSPLKLALGPKKVDATKGNRVVKSSKKLSDVTVMKQRSQTVSGILSSSDLSSRSEVRSRSMSDSKVRAQLKSSSTPDFSTNTPSTNKVSHSESLEDVSPGIQNYLANKLGLTQEQCIAVHRRMSSESSPDVSKLANRKTYSLDDVAHSLDIATSRGLPMTKVLDNLDGTADKNQNDTNVKNTELKSDGNLTNLQNEKPSSSANNDMRITEPQTLELESNVTDLKFSTSSKTRILGNGSGFVESPTGKSPTIDNQFKLVRKKAVYKPSAMLQSFSHLLGGKSSQVPLRRSRGKMDPSKRNTYTLESVAESLEKAQDAGVPMLDALKRLSGSCQGEPSDLPDEKRKTYDLEDLSNTLETASAAGVPIADTLRTIADPSGLPAPGTDEVFETPKPQDLESPKPQPKRKPPPKPKRTFSNSSKPEIKFVSDSFVIEYYTSPHKRSQSDSAVQGGRSKSQENYVESQEKYSDKAQEKYNNKPEENYYINQSTVDDTLDGKSISPSNKSQSGKGKGEIQGSRVQSPHFRNAKGKKPTTKVVSDLDSLLLKLAAEVHKPTNVDSSNIGINVEPSSNRPTTDVLSNTKPEFSSTKADFPNTKPENLGTKIDFSDTKQENLSTRTDLSDTKQENLSTKTDLSDTKQEKSSTKPNILNTNPDFSSTKLDDEGYCSLSRKPGTRSLKSEHESQLISDDLFKKEKLLTTFENSVDIREEYSNVEIIRSYDNNGRESQEGVIELTAEEDTKDQIPDSDSSDSPKADPVSRELNLLRLRLAEKQRDIEAQKQRTKEQQEEERKRFGQNVFWLAVGKGRERKDGSETSTTTKASHQTNFKQHLTTNQFGNASNQEPSNNNKFATFTKQSSLDEDLPPSMGKLQDRTYNKLIPEEKEPLPNQYQTCSVEDRKLSVDDRNPSEDTVQFRLSRQAPGAQDVLLNNEKSLNSEIQTPEKAKTPVLNYKSRINVPVSFQTKPISENCLDAVSFQNSENIVDGYKLGNFHEFDPNSKNEAKPPTSPQRKCWDTETVVNSESCIAVSESNYHIFDENNGRVARNSETTGTLDIEMNKDGRVMEAMNYMQGGSDSPGQTGDGVYLEMESVKKSPDEGDANLNSSPVEEDCDTPKKGLALFIGQENTVSNNDGLTPEQLRKREKFLRNRQQKIEEDKMKKEALLEKKRRKEEKMRDIQLRREQEEQSRQASLQEKREQAEHARQERQKYEMKRKEHLAQTNFSNGTLGANSGYPRIAMNTQGMDRVPGGNIGYNKTGMDTQCVDGIAGGNGRYGRSSVKTPTSAGNAFEVHGPTQSTTPSAFSGFTGVQSYVKPSGKTNRKLIINAISYVCLPGAVNKDTKEKCLQGMTESSAQHFLILFKEGFKFRALYSLDLESNQVLKVYGIGPRSVTEKMIEQLYKYNSGGKEFSKIPAKGFSLSVDGFTLQKSCWQSNKPSVSSKTASNFKQSTHRTAR